MKRISIFRAFAAISTVVACLILYLSPGREIYLHSDKVARLDDGSQGDRDNWEEFLRRTPYSSKAWKAVDSGNSLWQSKEYSSALDSWWKTAEYYRDTDAAYASLSNIATAQHELKNRQGATEAMQILLLLPSPHYHDQDRYVTVLKGTWWTGAGDVYKPETMTPIRAGGFLFHPAGYHHYDGARDEEVIVQIIGMGPVQTVRTEVDEKGQPVPAAPPTR